MEPIDIPEEGIQGVAVYGSKGALFVIGQDETVQQYTLYPPEVIATAQHRLPTPPPSPPVSFEEDKQPVIQRLQVHDDEYAQATMSPLRRIAHELEQLERMEQQQLGMNGLGIANLPPPIVSASVSNRSSQDSLGDRTGPQAQAHPHSVSSSASATRRPSFDRRPSSDERRGSEDATGSPSQQHQPGSPWNRRPSVSQQPYNPSSSPVHQRRVHPLRQEIYPSPQESKSAISIGHGGEQQFSLFTKLRERMENVVYESPRLHTTGKMNDDDHRKEMLHCVFGFRGDIDDIIKEDCKVSLASLQYR